jgi:glycosyltransferase involved in cell wall biosynthesis
MVSPLVKDVWRKLPVGVRRAIAHGMVMRFAPPLPNAAPAARAPDAPVIVVGFLTSASGLGQAARLAYAALEQQGRAVFGVDLSRYFFETADVVRFPFRDGRGHRGPARVLININAPYMKYVFHLLGRNFLREKWITGYWAWESSRAPADWRAGFARVHDVATPSAFVADAVRALGNAPPLRVAPHPVAIEALPALPAREEGAPFTVVSAFNVASGFERKNPLALVAAYRQAFGGRADRRLRLLVSNIEHYALGRAALEGAVAGDPTIEITYDALDRDGYWRWYGRPDLYASLHRAEGFGLPIAESMIAGVPVMATNWSANAEFVSAETGLPINCTLIPVRDAQRKYPEDGSVWADADVRHAAILLARAAEEPDWLATIARAGQVDALKRFARFDPWGDQTFE